MTEVRTTGVYIIGECDLQLDGCLARSPEPITVVKSQPNGRQINVCSACLQKMLDRQEWQLVGAGFRAQYDFVLMSSTNVPLVVLEVKRKPAPSEIAELRWARSYVRNLIAHGKSRLGRLLILSVLDGSTYFWGMDGRSSEPTLLANVETDQAFADLDLEGPIKGLDECFAESYYARFIESLITTGLGRGLPWLEDTGLREFPLNGAKIESHTTLSR